MRVHRFHLAFGIACVVACLVPVGSSAKVLATCFASPGACGYPDPAVGNVGVPAGTSLTVSTGFATTAKGQLIDGLDITGQIDVVNNDVTIENTRITIPAPGCGLTETCGNSGIQIERGVRGTRIEHVEIATAPDATAEHGVRNKSGSANVGNYLYIHGPDSGWYGQGTLENSYLIATQAIAGDHIEDVYCDGGTFRAIHDTLLNPGPQTANVFCNTNNGVGGACLNHVTVRDSLLSGGGYSLYTCGNASSVGTSTMDIENNHFTRCRTAVVYNDSTGGNGCLDGTDANGYWPHGGYFGTILGTYCPPLPGQTWAGNVWDDNGAPVNCGKYRPKTTPVKQPIRR